MHPAIILSRLRSEIISKGIQYSEASEKNKYQPINGFHGFWLNTSTSIEFHHIGVQTKNIETKLVCLLHEYGHYLSVTKMSVRRKKRLHQAYGRVNNNSATWLDKIITYWEEVKAWRLGWDVARRLGYTNLSLFNAVREFGLLTYEKSFWSYHASPKNHTSFPYYLNGSGTISVFQAPMEKLEER